MRPRVHLQIKALIITSSMIRLLTPTILRLKSTPLLRTLLHRALLLGIPCSILRRISTPLDVITDPPVSRSTQNGLHSDGWRIEYPQNRPTFILPLKRRFGVYESAVNEVESGSVQLQSTSGITSWMEIEQEMEKWKNEGSTAEAVAAVYRPMQQLGLIPLDFNTKSLIEHTVQNLEGFQAEDLAMIYYWSCKARFGNAEFLGKLTSQTLLRNLDDFSHKQLVLMLYGTGWLVKHQKSDSRSGRAPRTSTEGILFPGKDKFIDSIARALTSPPRLVHLKEQDLSNSIYSLGLLQYSANEVLYPILDQIDQSSKLLPRFLEQELANMLQGMASLGLEGHPTVAKLANEVVEKERLRIYKEPELCSILHSFAKLKFRNSDAIEILLREALRTIRLSAYTEPQLSNLLFALDQLGIDDQRLWRILLKEITIPERLVNFLPHHLANILYAVGRCSFQDFQSIDLILEAVLQENRMKNYSTREFSLMLYGLSRIQYSRPSVLSSISEELSQPGRLLEGSLPQKTISGILLSLATLNHRNQDLIERYLEDILQRTGLQEMDPEVLSQYIYSLGKLRVNPDRRIEEIVSCLVDSSEKLENLSQKGVGMVIYGLGQFGPSFVRKMEPISTILKSGIARVERFSIQDLSMVMYSLGLLKFSDFELIDRLINSFCRPDRIFKASTQHLSNFLYGLGLLHYPVKDIPLAVLETELGKPARIRNYSSQELANVVFSLGMLGLGNHGPFQTVLEKLMNEVIKPERLTAFRELELSCLVTGLGHLEHREPRILVPILEELTQDTRLERLKDSEIASILNVIGSIGICPDEICSKLLTEATRLERIKTYDIRSMISMIYSLGRLQNGNYPEVIGAFSEQLFESANAQELDEGHLANLLFGITHARFDSTKVLKLVFEEITKQRRLARFSSGEILNIMKSILTLRSRNVEVEGLDHVARIFAIEMTTLTRIPHFTSSQLVQVLHFLSVLRNKNVATTFPILKQLTRVENLNRLTPGDVARTVFSVGPMAFVNRQLHPRLALAVKPLLKQVVLGKGMESITCQSITELLVGLSMLGLKDPYVLDHVSNEIMKPMRLRSFRAWHLSRMFYAIGQLRYNNLELLRAMAQELSRPDRAQRLDYRHWSNIMSAVLMLKFKDEEFARIIEKQITCN